MQNAILINGLEFISTGKTVTSPEIHNSFTQSLKKDMDSGKQIAFVPYLDEDMKVNYEVYISIN